MSIICPICDMSVEPNSGIPIDVGYVAHVWCARLREYQAYYANESKLAKDKQDENAKPLARERTLWKALRKAAEEREVQILQGAYSQIGQFDKDRYPTYGSRPEPKPRGAIVPPASATFRIVIAPQAPPSVRKMFPLDVLVVVPPRPKKAPALINCRFGHDAYEVVESASLRRTVGATFTDNVDDAIFLCACYGGLVEPEEEASRPVIATQALKSPPQAKKQVRAFDFEEDSNA